ncbi:MAG: PHP domain-containing protein [Chloroflexi bacterium]|nr:PHP domain-containing protein [Chloroflexota bacterium]
MKSYRVELHIHSVLSACASLEMIPPFIIEKALASRIDILALTDHNSGANVPALLAAAEGTGITILPGMELATAEEIHAICLFDTLTQLQVFEKIVNSNLPNYRNNETFFGAQLVVDKDGNFIKKDERLLSTATRLPIIEAKNIVLELGGLFIPAHVEREENGLLPRLGGIPPEMELSIVEVSHYKSVPDLLWLWSDLKDLHIIKNGDAHDLDGILGLTQLQMSEVDIANLKKAILEQT